MPIAVNRREWHRHPMCNLYNVSIGPQAILEFTRAMLNEAGNLAPGSIWPDYQGPIVRHPADGTRRLGPAKCINQPIARNLTNI